MSVDDIRDKILNRFCSMLNVTALSDGSFSLSTPFLFPDGDGYPVVLERIHRGWRFTDRGSAAGHLFFDEIDMTEFRLNFVRRVAEGAGLNLSDDYEMFSDAFDALPGPIDLADFIQAIARVGAVVALERQAPDGYATRVRDQVFEWNPGTAEPNWHPVEDARRAYVADMRVGADLPNPVVLFFVGSSQKASSSTISIMKYSEWEVPVRPIVTYRPSLSSLSVYRLQEAMYNNGRVVKVEPNAPGFRSLRSALVQSGVRLTTQAG